MSKYIKTIPLSSIERIAIVTNRGPVSKWLTLEQAMRAQAVEPDIGINGGYYNGDGTPAAHLKADGAVLAAEDWSDWGYGWNEGSDIQMLLVPKGGATDCRNHITCKPLLTPWDGIDAPLVVGQALQGERGWQAVGLDGRHLVIRSSSDGADGITLRQLRDELYRMGCETALALDGGQSVMYRTRGGGVYLYNPRRPKVQNYIFIWLKPQKEEDKPVDGITTKYMSKNDCYTGGRTIKPKGIMVHSTAAPGVMAEALRSQWDKPGVDKAVHAMVDDKGVLQTLPWDRRGWHAGTGTSGRSANDTHIAFEVCEPQECRLLPIEWAPLKRGSTGWAVQRLQMELKARGYDPKGVDGSFGPGCEAALKACQRALGLTADGSCGPATLAALAKRTGSYLAYTPTETETYFRAVWGHAVALCAKLCKEYGLDPLKDILCHSEGYKAGIASNHADVMHWWPQHGESMDSFRAAVQAAVAGNPATDYRAKVQERFGLDSTTVDYLAAYTYGADLLRKLATAK